MITASAGLAAHSLLLGSTLGQRPPLFPQPFEAPAGHARVVHGVPGIAMPEIVLHGAQVGAFVCKIVAARVPQHVWMDPLQAGTFAGDPNQVLHGRAC